MKKVIKVFMVVSVMFLCGFTVTAERNVKAASAEPVECIENVSYEKEGIGCKVFKNGQKVASCLICNCAKLAEAIHGG
ncbi:MAG: hypothetical protein AAF693_21535 [Bacteroidota bacterium]